MNEVRKKLWETLDKTHEVKVAFQGMSQGQWTQRDIEDAGRAIIQIHATLQWVTVELQREIDAGRIRIIREET